jgi:hypothetical protein
MPWTHGAEVIVDGAFKVSLPRSKSHMASVAVMDLETEASAKDVLGVARRPLRGRLSRAAFESGSLVPFHLRSAAPWAPKSQNLGVTS